MSERDPLAPDLAELERRLAARRPAEAPAALRSRVVAVVAQELACETRRNRWEFASTFGAAAMVLANLVFIVTGSAAHDLGELPSEPGQVEARAAELLDVFPHLTREEARRLAIMEANQSWIVPMPYPPTTLFRE